MGQEKLKKLKLLKLGALNDLSEYSKFYFDNDEMLSGNLRPEIPDIGIGPAEDNPTIDNCVNYGPDSHLEL